MPPDVLPRIAAGDREAVRECLDRYGGMVWSLARRALGGTAQGGSDAEDAVQEIFVELWRHAGRFDAAKASEATFVALVARRRLIDRRRRRGAAPCHTLPADPGDALSTEPARERSGATPLPLEIREEAERARAALEELAPDQRRVIEMATAEGLSYSRIAERLSLPLGTVKTHARRGLIRLRELLSADASASAAAEETATTRDLSRRDSDSPATRPTDSPAGGTLSVPADSLASPSVYGLDPESHAVPASLPAISVSEPPE